MGKLLLSFPMVGLAWLAYPPVREKNGFMYVNIYPSRGVSGIQMGSPRLECVIKSEIFVMLMSGSGGDMVSGFLSLMP